MITSFDWSLVRVISNKVPPPYTCQTNHVYSISYTFYHLKRLQMNKNVARHIFIVVWPRVIKEMLYVLWNRWYITSLDLFDTTTQPTFSSLPAKTFIFSLKFCSGLTFLSSNDYPCFWSTRNHPSNEFTSLYNGNIILTNNR